VNRRGKDNPKQPAKAIPAFQTRRAPQTTNGTEAPVHRWPPWFSLSSVDVLRKVQIDKGEWLGVYQGPVPDGELLCVSRSPIVLISKLKRLTVNWPVFVHRSTSKEDLVRPIPRKPEDNFSRLRRHSYEAIAEARKRMSPDYPFTTSEEKQQAQEFLHHLAKQARRAGKKRGRRTTQEHDRRMIEAFKRIFPTGATKLGNTKDAIPVSSSEPVDAMAKKLRTEMRRFAMRVHKARSFPVSIKERYERCGFTLSEWPLAKEISALGAEYIAREQKRQEAKLGSHSRNSSLQS
jgi:hypothetical protein